MRRTIVYRSLFALSVCAFLGAQSIAEADTGKLRHYVAKQLPEVAEDLRPLKIERAQQYGFGKDRIVATGSSAELDTTTDIGLRLFLIEKRNNDLRIKYQSKGSGDSYNLSPTFYKSLFDDSWIALAEMGAEYSWGIRVFLFRGDTVLDIGTLDVGVFRQHGAADNIESAVPFTVIERSGNSIIFRFTTDVVLDPGGKNQSTVPQGGIKYVYSNGALKVLLTEQNGK
jgi:hypothetical protein